MRKPAFIVFLFISSISALNAQTSALKIFEAVKTNDLKEVKSLLEKGTDPNIADEDGDLLLMYATMYSSVECMALLIEKGSNVNAKNKIDETALMWAVHDLAKIKLLI